MLTTTIDNKTWAATTTSSAERLVALTNRLSELDIDCMVEVHNKSQVGPGLPKYTISVPYTNKYDLLQVDIALNVPVKDGVLNLTAEQRARLRPDMNLNMLSHLDNGMILVVDCLNPNHPLYVIATDGEIKSIETAFGL